MHYKVAFPSGTVTYHFTGNDTGALDVLIEHYDIAHTIFITNEDIARLYPQFFTGRKYLVIPASEQSKALNTIASLITQLLQLEVTRHTLLVGVGGGVVTDITGFLGSVYMRGISFGYIPTSLLGMVDAAVGGKNGVNAGLHKNIIGTVNQPSFIIYDTSFLDTLAREEWSNGFAEIIKYACIFDEALFNMLMNKDLTWYTSCDKTEISKIIQTAVAWKNKTVQEDEHEKGIRKLLNFGHTAAHAIENIYTLSHGKAVAIGMVIAAMLSERETGLPASATNQLKQILRRYDLPVHINIDTSKAMEILKMDKKRKDDMIDYILLERIGKATIKPLPLPLIKDALLTYENSH